MTLLTRVEFIGKNKHKETVFGHKFATSFEEVKLWLEENEILEYIVEICGWVPEELVLNFDTVRQAYEEFDNFGVFSAVLKQMNTFMQKYLDDLYGELE